MDFDDAVDRGDLEAMAAARRRRREHAARVASNMGDVRRALRAAAGVVAEAKWRGHVPPAVAWLEIRLDALAPEVKAWLEGKGA